MASKQIIVLIYWCLDGLSYESEPPSRFPPSTSLLCTVCRLSLPAESRENCCVDAKPVRCAVLADCACALHMGRMSVRCTFARLGFDPCPSRWKQRPLSATTMLPILLPHKSCQARGHHCRMRTVGVIAVGVPWLPL